MRGANLCVRKPHKALDKLLERNVFSLLTLSDDPPLCIAHLQ
jgi:hypothetical protein